MPDVPLTRPERIPWITTHVPERPSERPTEVHESTHDSTSIEPSEQVRGVESATDTAEIVSEIDQPGEPVAETDEPDQVDEPPDPTRSFPELGTETDEPMLAVRAVEPAEPETAVPVAETTELVGPAAEANAPTLAGEGKEPITDSELIEPLAREEHAALTGRSTAVGSRVGSPRWAETEHSARGWTPHTAERGTETQTTATTHDPLEPNPHAETEEAARGRTPPSAERGVKTHRPASAQEPVEPLPQAEAKDPARSSTPRAVDWEAETPPSSTARARLGSLPRGRKVRELEAEFGPVEVSRPQMETSPRLRAAQSLTKRKDLEFFKPRVEALITNRVESRRQQAAQDIWTRAVTIVVPSVTLDNQQQALREGLLQWLTNDIQPAGRTGEASRKQPWIVGWFFDLLREVVIALAKEALIELLMPGFHLIIPPTGLVDAIFAACRMLEIADAA